MHVSGLIKRSRVHVMGGAAGAQDAVAKPAAKKPTAKEIREENKWSKDQAREGIGQGNSYCIC